ncbi:CrtK/TspO family sensor protein [Devosia limi DSM 17137]|uniref:CrtK/TspO family sensor protein n=1 Tax=Devosia limi DSM 17137 TaxID=1121477 RepID=A0A0F5LU28_9HYPH|nr:TspO/MBR family protein [Devosia limi]KKB85791.1 CrtK/TspO family sensor protein [Devosia limi DSM 17137]SHE32841.1 TspO and MBR related proteins [Devosia limi DSM 17137]
MSVPSLADYRTPGPWFLLALFLLVVICVGALIGMLSIPTAWYEALAKPPFNPPNWIFGPVWFTLYVMIAVAGWRIYMIDPRAPAMKLWYIQMGLNWIWSPVWFVAQLIWPAFAIIALLWVVLIAFVLSARKLDPFAAWLFVPYLLWVSFAALLNLSIGVLN